eukprot:CAMPEP_0202686442 /NCGR_PEP_ID=MMETSP1385-20130828/2224_1 /ASSEMBLY_ACC=CAM_ASM_000861 /TAXON_ID=933848 /ORGANISM="Elphidium margaritaceum" /LENGTH=198 /DNA_ID=CAMNT_0049341015 /DNA_START=155 /DNA_END=748 /DNA_ORIENTATION=+
MLLHFFALFFCLMSSVTAVRGKFGLGKVPACHAKTAVELTTKPSIFGGRKKTLVVQSWIDKAKKVPLSKCELTLEPNDRIVFTTQMGKKEEYQWNGQSFANGKKLMSLQDTVNLYQYTLDVKDPSGTVKDRVTFSKGDAAMMDYYNANKFEGYYGYDDEDYDYEEYGEYGALDNDLENSEKLIILNRMYRLLQRLKDE